MSVFPYLDMTNAGGGTPNYRYLVENNGIGPAIIKVVKIVDAKKRVFDDFAPFVTANLTETDTFEYYHSNVSVGRLIPEKETVQVIQIDGNRAGGLRLREIINDDRVKIEIEYESIYGERWLLTNESNFPKKL